jgi:hypothetical protein
MSEQKPFEPVVLVKNGQERTARSPREAVSLQFDGFSPKVEEVTEEKLADEEPAQSDPPEQTPSTALAIPTPSSRFS